ncbi:MAG: tol-pal system-associated acyl-CoA thioesterase [Zhongshania sp.]|uniref:tol-pal system-associated acyl-CoA thioesterase n=1 Tax=Zhongshania sp. TaxID=1971902 RepID=UPI0026173A57|nr:tol-pal system-associated acyl-CoA thioesterase [Zhongshania sp.]MDF1691959.1 tol-pal system-associated acyl-CoA thioesterase [Zhongshania sp.]
MEFSLPLRVYIEDTDAGGIVYYVNYLKFMERARTEYMRAQGFSKAAIMNDALMFVVSALQTKYLRPARLDEQLIVTARVLAAARVSLCFEQRVYRGEELLCEAEVTVACVDSSTLKPKRIPTELLAALKH